MHRCKHFSTTLGLRQLSISSNSSLGLSIKLCRDILNCVEILYIQYLIIYCLIHSTTISINFLISGLFRQIRLERIRLLEEQKQIRMEVEREREFVRSQVQGARWQVRSHVRSKVQEVRKRVQVRG
jgi:hypothetical protein